MTTKIRKMKTAWTDEEHAILRAHWHNGVPVKEWMHKLPNRTYGAIQARSVELGLGSRGKVNKAGRSISWALIRKLLASSRPMSTLEISEIIGISRRSVDYAVRQHYPADLHIGDWGPQGADGVRSRLWSLGPGKDARKPRTPSKAERSHQRWKELKKDPERLGLHYSKIKTSNARRAGRLIRPDAATVWLKVPPQHHEEPVRPEHYRDTRASPQVGMMGWTK